MTWSRLAAITCVDKDYQPDNVLLARWHGEVKTEPRLRLPLWTAPCVYLGTDETPDHAAALFARRLVRRGRRRLERFGPEICLPEYLSSVFPYILIRDENELKSMSGGMCDDWQLLRCEWEMAQRLGSKEPWMHTILERLWGGSVRQFRTR